MLRDTLTIALLLAGSLPDDVRWQLDFLGPTVERADGRMTPGAVRYWNDIVGVAFTRDVSIEIPPTPVDLNLDGRPDVNFRGRYELPGGILANPRMVGLVATPDDPVGTVGTTTVSTGFLGVREELDPLSGRGTGRYGFNCWLCHASADELGRVVLGRPNAKIDLGLIMATARALDPQAVIRRDGDGAALTPDELAQLEGLAGIVKLDINGDGQVTIEEWRQAQQMPSANETRATLLLAGPGRLDQSIDHRMDGLVPLAQLQQHTRQTAGAEAFRRQAAAPKRDVFNPLSIPDNRVGLGVAHYSWSGKDSAMRADAVRQLTMALGISSEELGKTIEFDARPWFDAELLNRAITLDFRNVSTAGKEDDDLEGIAWPERMLTNPTLELLTNMPPKFGAFRLRKLLTASRGSLRAELPSNYDQVREGARLFCEKPCGEIINQRVLIEREALVPPEFRGIAVLAPLDRSKSIAAKIEVRCATCHNYTVASTSVGWPGSGVSDFQRCDLCHMDHPSLTKTTEGKTEREQTGRFLAIREHMQTTGLTSFNECVKCHETHPNFGPLAFSNSWLLPFDVNGNATTFGDEAADQVAGGIGTDALMNADTLFRMQLRPVGQRPPRVYLVTDNARAQPRSQEFSRTGLGWVRVAPLIDLAGSAPYLHNGSVPTLDALLAPASQRPSHFQVGDPEQRFTFDTRLPGNRNGGHEFGVNWSTEEKAAVIAFMQSLR